MNARIRSPLRRTAAAACVLAIGMLLAGQAVAQPPGRMDSEQRERLRRELRKHDEQRADRTRSDRGNEARRRAPPSRERLSPVERERLREQLRNARPAENRRGGSRRR